MRMLIRLVMLAIGLVMGLPDMLPSIRSVQADWLPDYFAAAQELLSYGVAAELVTESNWRRLENKVIYSHFVSTMPQVSVEQSYGFSFERAWKRLHSDLVEPDDRDNLYLLVHNKLPTPERMERIKVVKDGYCGQCPGSVRADL